MDTHTQASLKLTYSTTLYRRRAMVDSQRRWRKTTRASTDGATHRQKHGHTLTHRHTLMQRESHRQARRQTGQTERSLDRKERDVKGE